MQGGEPVTAVKETGLTVVRIGRALVLAGGLASSLGGCIPVMLGAAGGTAIAASEERGLPTAAADKAIEAKINDAWFKKSIDMANRLGVTVVEGNVLVVGHPADQQMHDEAIQLVKAVPGVKDVYDETKIGQPGDFGDQTHDVWITTQLRTQLALDPDIRSINYIIDTVDCTIYLMGIARSQTELDKVLDHARNIAYVHRVVSHVLIQPPTPAPVAPSATDQPNQAQN